ncbi:aldehyde dehydrogenase family protein [Agrococcus sp. Marseille-Q4369]|uniref:aldehyde dehydrogenase family protein n=1 Tax=Agrococcus sp. Marseille-Q4369 TaxID=2810513 RepID=UPI001B8C0DB2|nr:aldehyde dehydrogenase family protein [Agrococcus sp. Marseille-Q4369]QUW17851.1 aldehyde dehydrogenase family protein [Agrococcus sp. Marseille-Q4369]
MTDSRNHDVVTLPGGGNLPQGSLIHGAWVPNTGDRRDVFDPATGQRLATVREAAAEEVAAAVDSARRAQSGWAERSVHVREALLIDAARVINENADLLARVETLDTGKPLSQSQTDVAIAEQYFRFYAHASRHFFGETIPSASSMQVRTEREPHGVVAHITPWNAPLSQWSRGVAPSLAVGNTVVVKPSELAPLSTLLVADLLKDVLPAGIMNVVPGDGSVTGAALASSPGIDHLTFTGSVATGIRVAQMAAANVVAANLELGGKSAAIVFPDADLQSAAAAAANALVRNTGQSCSALTRFIVHSSVADEFERLLVDATSSMVMGPGIDDFQLGPLVSEAQRDRVVGLVQRAAASGAAVVTHSELVPTAPELRDGWFVSPTVLTHVTPEMEVATTEVFGPVQTVLRFDEEAQAVAIANGTSYGLTAAVFTRDVDVVARLSRSLRAGQVQINGFVGAGMEIPFGGIKHSGFGREKGFEALYGYTQVKTIVTHVGTRA